MPQGQPEAYVALTPAGDVGRNRALTRVLVLCKSSLFSNMEVCDSLQVAPPQGHEEYANGEAARRK
jgi:hypothetical protein